MLDIPTEIPKDAYEFLRSLLETGKAETERFKLDLSDLQSISIKGGVLKFNPPVKVAVKIGLISVATTLTKIENKKDGILINIDNSPIDLEVVPSE